jgi:peroxiredoxin
MRRFSALIENGVATIVNVEPQGEMQCSLANELLSKI